MNIYFYFNEKDLFCALVADENNNASEGEIFQAQLGLPSVFFGKSLIYNNDVHFIQYEDLLEVKGVRWGEIGESFILKQHHGNFLLDALSILWEFMPGGLVYTGINPFLKLSDFEDITFYGGSFNPWHDGHLECLNRCMAKSIIVIPDYNPWKDEQKANGCRYESFIKIYKKLKKTNFSLYPGFWAMDTTNPTIDWIFNTKASQVSLLIGDDNFMEIFKWKKYQELLNYLNKLYVVRRNYSREDFENKWDMLKGKGVDINIRYIDKNEYDHLSSSELRKTKAKK